MVSTEANHRPSNADIYNNVMQGKVFSDGNPLPKIVWNQMKILVISNKDGNQIGKTTRFSHCVRSLS